MKSQTGPGRLWLISSPLMFTEAEIQKLRRSAQRWRRPEGPTVLVTCQGGPLDGLRVHLSAGMKSGSWAICTVKDQIGCVCSNYDVTGKFLGYDMPGSAASGMRAT